MADEKSYPMTQAGKEKLETELKDLKVNQRPKIVERIKIARSYGDLSENSEYEAAKNEQSMLESRITTVEHMLQYAQVVADDDSKKGVANVGKSVTFKELPNEDPETYQIVGEAEADPMNGKISNESPIAKGLIGHKKGEEVELQIPSGVMKVKITDVK